MAAAGPSVQVEPMNMNGHGPSGCSPAFDRRCTLTGTPSFTPRPRSADIEVIATGRSDYPNQINNVLAFPGVFRGALDVRASEITSEMEVAAARAVPEIVRPEELEADYIVPSVFNRDVAPAVAEAVALAAERSGVARRRARELDPSELAVT
jgi:malic enzyme